MDADESSALAGVKLSHLDQPVFDGAGATKGDLVRYLDAVHERMLPELQDRALSVVRARLGQEPFMQKNLPKYAPDWIRTTTVWANASKREVHYPVCDDRRTLVWLANQRAVEYHPALIPVDSDRQTHLILDLDQPDDVEPLDGFRMAVTAALLVRQVLDDAGLSGGVKTSGAKGVHVFVPLTDAAEIPDVAAATRAIAARAARLDPTVATTEFVREERDGKVFVDSTRAGGATVVAAYSPRVRPGVPVSFPVTWDELEQVRPGELTILTAAERLSGDDPWAAATASPQALPADLVAEGHEIPIARVVAMHEGKRRKREEERHQAEAAVENASSPGGRAL
ncbi:MAG: bifunctional non-ous end joining protein LigD [Nocardioidaceae bacterium]|nr:bifunctional non-ous end joining protein LigD [Nocardioidaceae bacterium]